MTLAREDRHLLCMAENDRIASSRQLAARWSTATGVLMSALSICRRLQHSGLHESMLFYMIHLTVNHQQLHLQWGHEHRAWQADWHQVVFSDESRFSFWDHDVYVRVRRFVIQRCLPECVFERHNGQTSRVMVWGVIAYH